MTDNNKLDLNFKPENISIGGSPISSELDLSALRLTQNFDTAVAVKKIITTVPCRKPSNQIFVRVRSGDDWKMTAAILQIKDDNECFLVVPALYTELINEARPKMLYTGITRDGNPFIWPVNVPDNDDRLDAWSQSAHDAIKLAENSWIRLTANRTNGAYDVVQAVSLAEEPTWPDLSFQQLINLAFKDKIINSLDHPIVKRLRGEA